MIWDGCCRNSSITTVSSNSNGAGNMRLESEVHMVKDTTMPAPFNGYISSSGPIFTRKPIFHICVNQVSNLNFGAFDPDGDSLVFSLTNCYGANYLSSFVGTNPMTTSTLNLNPNTGILTVLPTITQTAIICVTIKEYRNGEEIGETVRDIQIIVTNCNNAPPVASGINGLATAAGVTGSYSTNACLGQSFCFDFQIYDSDSNYGLGAEYLGIDSTVSLTIDTSQFPATGTICWTPHNNYGMNYLIPIRVFDDVCPLVGESFYIYEINLKPFDANIDSTSLGPILSGSSIMLSTSSTNTSCQYTWTPSATLSCSTCPNPIATPMSTITYYASINCGGLCATTVDSVTLLVNSTSTTEISTIQNVILTPNPSKNYTLLEYDLLQNSNVRIEIFDIVGRQLRALVDENQLKGYYIYNLQEKQLLNKGIYFVKLTINEKVVTKKLLVQ